MNGEPISAKERRKARAMVRDIAKQVPFQGEYISADEWWLIVFAGAYGQELIPNPFRGDFPSAPLFILRNNKRTKNLNVSNGAELITALYAFGSIKGVEWSDPEWKAMREQERQESRRAA